MLLQFKKPTTKQGQNNDTNTSRDSRKVTMESRVLQREVTLERKNIIPYRSASSGDCFQDDHAEDVPSDEGTSRRRI